MPRTGPTASASTCLKSIVSSSGHCGLELADNRRAQDAVLVRHGKTGRVARRRNCRAICGGCNNTRPPWPRNCASNRTWGRSLNDEFRRQLEKCVPLHDIGKLALPDAVLLKPGPLTPDERRSIESHTTIGSAIVDSLTRRIRRTLSRPGHGPGRRPPSPRALGRHGLPGPTGRRGDSAGGPAHGAGRRLRRPPPEAAAQARILPRPRRRVHLSAKWTVRSTRPSRRAFEACQDRFQRIFLSVPL